MIEDLGLSHCADSMVGSVLKKVISGGKAEDTSPIGFFQAFMLPNVISYAAAFGFFKLVRINI